MNIESPYVFELSLDMFRSGFDTCLTQHNFEMYAIAHLMFCILSLSSVTLITHHVSMGFTYYEH